MNYSDEFIAYNKMVHEVSGAVLEGNEIEREEHSGWIVKTRGTYHQDSHYRIKPGTVVVNGIDVPAPEVTMPAVGAQYYTPYAMEDTGVGAVKCVDDRYDQLLLRRGLIHLTKENALKHAEALGFTK